MAGSPLAILALAIRIYSIIIIARVLLSWLPPESRPYELDRLLHRATEPVLRPIRAMLPRTGGIDLSPLVALILLAVLRRIVLSL